MIPDSYTYVRRANKLQSQAMNRYIDLALLKLTRALRGMVPHRHAHAHMHGMRLG
jgi:hypothetical protein